MSLSLWSRLGSPLPPICSLMVTGGRGAGASIHPCKCQGEKGPMVTLPWLCAPGLLAKVCWGFLKPSPQASPSPGRDRAALLSTWQLVALQDYLLPCLLPHPQLEESPCSSLSAACSPLGHSHPLRAVIRARGCADTSTVALSTASLPVLIFLP